MTYQSVHWNFPPVCEEAWNKQAFDPTYKNRLRAFATSSGSFDLSTHNSYPILKRQRGHRIIESQYWMTRSTHTKHAPRMLSSHGIAVVSKLSVRSFCQDTVQFLNLVPWTYQSINPTPMLCQSELILKKTRDQVNRCGKHHQQPIPCNRQPSPSFYLPCLDNICAKTLRQCDHS